jgi:hypothetical protein
LDGHSLIDHQESSSAKHQEGQSLAKPIPDTTKQQ